MTIDLPWPPSANRYYRNVRGRTLISREGREYRKDVATLCRVQCAEKLTGRVSVHIAAHPPDRRRRDLDNALKATLDSLQHGGVFADDGQIDHLAIERKAVAPGGLLRVLVWEFEP